MAKTLESIRGRQPAVDALIGHEHYPRIRRLQTHSDWQGKLLQPTLIGYKNYQKIRATRTGIEKGYGRTYKDHNISGYASSRQVATTTKKLKTFKTTSRTKCNACVANLVAKPLNQSSTGREVLSLISCQVTTQRTKCWRCFLRAALLQLHLQGKYPFLCQNWASECVQDSG